MHNWFSLRYFLCTLLYPNFSLVSSSTSQAQICFLMQDNDKPAFRIMFVCCLTANHESKCCNTQCVSNVRFITLIEGWKWWQFRRRWKNAYAFCYLAKIWYLFISWMGFLTLWNNWESMRAPWLFGLSMCTFQWFSSYKFCSHKGQN